MCLFFLFNFCCVLYTWGEKAGSKGGSLAGSLASGLGSMESIKSSVSLISKRVLTLSSSSTILCVSCLQSLQAIVLQGTSFSLLACGQSGRAAQKYFCSPLASVSQVVPFCGCSRSTLPLVISSKTIQMIETSEHFSVND